MEAEPSQGRVDGAVEQEEPTPSSSPHSAQTCQTFERVRYDGLAVLGPARGAVSKHRCRRNARARNSRFFGVCGPNPKGLWQARILVGKKVTHLGYYTDEVEAATVYDRVALAVNGSAVDINFPVESYSRDDIEALSVLTREQLQRHLGVKPMEKSSRYRGVSRKKNKWEAKVMVNRCWVYRELFDTEEEAARAYDEALRRLRMRDVGNLHFNFGADDDIGATDAVANSSKLLALSNMGPVTLPCNAATLPPSPAHAEGSSGGAGMTTYDAKEEEEYAAAALQRQQAAAGLSSGGNAQGQHEAGHQQACKTPPSRSSPRPQPNTPYTITNEHIAGLVARLQEQRTRSRQEPWPNQPAAALPASPDSACHATSGGAAGGVQQAPQRFAASPPAAWESAGAGVEASLRQPAPRAVAAQSLPCSTRAKWWTPRGARLAPARAGAVLPPWPMPPAARCAGGWQPDSCDTDSPLSALAGPSGCSCRDGGSRHPLQPPPAAPPTCWCCAEAPRPAAMADEGMHIEGMEDEGLHTFLASQGPDLWTPPAEEAARGPEGGAPAGQPPARTLDGGLAGAAAWQQPRDSALDGPTADACLHGPAPDNSVAGRWTCGPEQAARAEWAAAGGAPRAQAAQPLPMAPPTQFDDYMGDLLLQLEGKELPLPPLFGGGAARRGLGPMEMEDEAQHQLGDWWPDFAAEAADGSAGAHAGAQGSPPQFLAPQLPERSSQTRLNAPHPPPPRRAMACSPLPALGMQTHCRRSRHGNGYALGVQYAAPCHACGSAHDGCCAPSQYPLPCPGLCSMYDIDDEVRRVEKCIAYYEAALMAGSSTRPRVRAQAPPLGAQAAPTMGWRQAAAMEAETECWGALAAEQAAWAAQRAAACAARTAGLRARDCRIAYR